MIIEAILSREQLIRLSILRHIQRSPFYFYAVTCAALTAYGLIFGPTILLLAGWAPFLLYMAIGIFGAIKAGGDANHPALLETRYELDKSGVMVTNSAGKSVLGWEHFSDWKIIAKCYILTLSSGDVLAIPQTAVSSAQVAKFEGWLEKYIG